VESALATRRARRSTRWTARIGVVALIASAFVLATATSVWADAPDVSTTTGTVLNADPLSDGFVQIGVQGEWAWSTHHSDCNTNRYAAGWAVDWNDAAQDGNVVGTLGSDTIAVGVADGSQGSALNPTDNDVHVTDPPRCGVFANHGAFSYNTGEWGDDSVTGDTTHKYELPADVDTPEELNDFIASLTPCAVMYDVHGNADAPNNPSKELKAGGSGHNDDNSVQKNGQTPAGNVCAAIDVLPIPPDVKVVKTAPAQVTLGETITYTITVTNTGTVETSVTLQDVIPANTTFVSASSECHLDDEDPTLLICQFGLIQPGGSATVQVTVMPTAAGTVVNTAVVTPDDSTPDDNTSTVSTAVIEPAAQAVAVTPAFTG
jgi:uncharacterized repeat protein (TIGR01451 family)